MTVEGIEAIANPLRADPGKLKTLIVGAGTFRAYQAFDRLLGAGISPSALYVHLGHTRLTGAGAVNKFYKYHPMLHGKIYLLDMPDGKSSAFIGSHNLTGFALLGLNGEAGVLIEGPTDSQQMSVLREHINKSLEQSVSYAPGMKEAYSWWTSQFVEGLHTKVLKDQPQTSESQKTIVILAVSGEGSLPKKDDLIYFEIPAALGHIASLRAEVHIYIFDTRPSSPEQGLTALSKARKSLWCKTVGLEDEQGGVELRADWYVDDKTNAVLRRAPKPFRPSPPPGMQQVRVKVWYRVSRRFEYLFDTPKAGWEPVLSQQSQVRVLREERGFLETLKLIPPEDREWFLVMGLRPIEHKLKESYKRALRESSPEAGSFILMSVRRRKEE